MEPTDELLNNCEGIKLIALSTSIATILAQNLDLDNQNVIGNLLQGIGQNLLIIAAQNSKYQNCIQKCNDNIKNKT